MAKKYGLVVDLRKCINCHTCQVSCKMENQVPLGVYRTRNFDLEVGEFPNTKRYFFQASCNHCENPPCVVPCPVKGATYKRPEDGIVVVNADLCIGCGLCVDACPYGARFLNPTMPIKNNPRKYFDQVPELRDKDPAELRVADKCNFCLSRLEAGEEPACVRNCVGKARVFGDLNDPESAVAKLVRENKTLERHPEYGTGPELQVKWIPADEAAFHLAEQKGLI